MSIDFLSRLGSSKSFLPSTYSLSSKGQKSGSFNRQYSTYSGNTSNLKG